MNESSPTLRLRRRSRTSNNQTTVSVSPEPTTAPTQYVESVKSESDDVMEEDLMSQNLTHSSSSDSFNELRSDLTDSARNHSIESEYTDDTHDWLDSTSSEYAHFLGHYD